MDAIEIFFTVYGALLALAVAKLMSNVARIARARDGIRIGWSMPLFMLLLLLDICSLINNGGRILGLADLSLRLVTNGVITASLYYLLATLTAPNDGGKITDLDDYYDRHRPLLIGGMALGSVLGFEVNAVLIRGFSETLEARWMGLNATLMFAFYLLLGVLLFVRHRAVNHVALAILNAIFLVVLFTF